MSKAKTKARKPLQLPARSAAFPQPVKGQIVRISESGPGNLNLYAAPRKASGHKRRGGGIARRGIVDRVVHTVGNEVVPLAVGGVASGIADNLLSGLPAWARNGLLLVSGAYLATSGGKYKTSIGVQLAMRGATNFLFNAAPGTAPAQKPGGGGLWDWLRGIGIPVNPILTGDAAPKNQPPGQGAPFNRDNVRKAMANYSPQQKQALQSYLESAVRQRDGFSQLLDVLQNP